jgi:hypothetical protein
MLFSMILWLHILSAVVAFGSNLTYFPWLSGVKKSAPSLVFTLRTLKKIDDWMANPAYVLAFFTGAGLCARQAGTNYLIMRAGSILSLNPEAEFYAAENAFGTGD